MYRQATLYCQQAVDANLATGLLEILKNDIQWEDGVRSRYGFTRKAKAIDIEEFPQLHILISNVLKKMTSQNYAIYGVYLNYYENGRMYTPNHSHKGTQQLVISLGAARTLNLGKRSYHMQNGDAIIFGSSVHGVPKEPQVTEGRISIATFMQAL